MLTEEAGIIKSGSFKMKPHESMTELEVLETILPELIGTDWEAYIQNRIKEITS